MYLYLANKVLLLLLLLLLHYTKCLYSYAHDRRRKHIVFRSSARPSVVRPSVNTCFASRDISSHSGQNPMQLTTNIYHASVGIAEKLSKVRDQRSRNYLVRSVNR